MYPICCSRVPYLLVHFLLTERSRSFMSSLWRLWIIGFPRLLLILWCVELFCNASLSTLPFVRLKENVCIHSSHLEGCFCFCGIADSSVGCISKTISKDWQWHALHIKSVIQNHWDTLLKHCAYDRICWFEELHVHFFRWYTEINPLKSKFMKIHLEMEWVNLWQ